MFSFSPFRVLVMFYICISHKNQLSIFVFSCIIVLIHFPYGHHFNAVYIYKYMCCHLVFNLARCDLVVVFTVYI